MIYDLTFTLQLVVNNYYCYCETTPTTRVASYILGCNCSVLISPQLPLVQTPKWCLAYSLNFYCLNLKMAQELERIFSLLLSPDTEIIRQVGNTRYIYIYKHVFNIILFSRLQLNFREYIKTLSLQLLCVMSSYNQRILMLVYYYYYYYYYYYGIQIRQLSAVLLRKKLGHMWRKLTPEERER